MSLHATSYRYEQMLPREGLVNALARQTERIRLDELYATREHQAQFEASTNLKSAWNENQDLKAAYKRGVFEKKQIESELKMCQKGALLVRQAALQKLLEEDYQRYERELHALGKAFYIKRE